MIKPFIIAAISADGYIAPNANSISTSWTSKGDIKKFVELTKGAGVVIMGSKTFETIGKPLSGRVNIIYSRSGKTYPGTETTDKEPSLLLKELEERGFKEAAICGGAAIYSLFLKSGLVSKLYLTVEPVLFGTGIHLSDEPLHIKLKLESTKQLGGGAVLFEYSTKHGDTD